MPSIFVSYRRDDAPGHAGRLYDRLVDRFGEQDVFMDLDTLEPGADFAEVITDRVSRSDALLAVIGPGWLSAARDGARRLDDPDDWVRFEIAGALARGVRVVPILVQRARMPQPDELPDELRALTRRHATELLESTWRTQVDQLLESLEQALRRAAESPRLGVRPSPRRDTAWGIADADSHGHLREVEPPAAVDLRRPWHRVADQGGASSVGWAVADSVLRWQLVAAGRFDARGRLSTQYVWEVASDLERAGSPPTSIRDEEPSLKAALDVLRKFGVPLERGWPVEPGPDPGRDSAARHRILAYYSLGDDAMATAPQFAAWRRWMHQQGPVLVRLRVDRALLDAGVGILESFDEASVVGDQAAALFGYDGDRLLLRSSWGEAWGHGGYARLDRDYAAAAIVESWGIVV